MKNTLCALAAAAALLFAPAIVSTASAAGATAICKDGSQYTGSSTADHILGAYGCVGAYGRCRSDEKERAAL